MNSQKLKKTAVAVTFLAVPIILLMLFTYVPFIDMVRYSFYKWNGTSPTMKFIGLKNYIQIFTRSEYLMVFKTSIYYFVGSIVQIVVALYFAVILTAKIRGASFFKGVIFFPYLINGVAIGFIFMYFFRQAGTLDTILMALGVPQSKIPLWLGNPRIINYSLTSVSVWRYLVQNGVMLAGAL